MNYLPTTFIILKFLGYSNTVQNFYTKVNLSGLTSTETKMTSPAIFLRHCNVREILQDVIDGELEFNIAPGVTFCYQILKMLVLSQEFILHELPNDLNKEKVECQGFAAI